jgi:hypothetical protein
MTLLWLSWPMSGIGDCFSEEYETFPLVALRLLNSNPVTWGNRSGHVGRL